MYIKWLTMPSAKGCYGTKMRSVVKDKDNPVAIVGQQFLLAEIIA